MAIKLKEQGAVRGIIAAKEIVRLKRIITLKVDVCCQRIQAKNPVRLYPKQDGRCLGYDSEFQTICISVSRILVERRIAKRVEAGKGPIFIVAVFGIASSQSCD